MAFVRIPEAIFELNFAGLFNFGGLGAATLNPAFAGAPDFTPGSAVIRSSTWRKTCAERSAL